MWLLLTEFSYNKMRGLFAETAKGGHSNKVTVFEVPLYHRCSRACTRRDTKIVNEMNKTNEWVVNVALNCNNTILIYNM